MVEKPWGRDELPAPFTTPAGRRIGEIWFEPPAELNQLLVKYIFTSDKLSVQVHPSDAQTLAAGLGWQGKEECWLVLDAEPGARLGIGFDRSIDAGALRAAALDGGIEHMLVWHEVRAGDFFYIPANTVHAIGAGVSLVEIQQNSDITYRLFDYGRPRELHLDEAVAVARGEPYADPRHVRLGPSDSRPLVEGPYFRLDRVAGVPSEEVVGRYASAPLLVIPLSGDIRVAGLPVAPGDCALVRDFTEIDAAEAGMWLATQPIHGEPAR